MATATVRKAPLREISPATAGKDLSTKIAVWMGKRKMEVQEVADPSEEVLPHHTATGDDDLRLARGPLLVLPAWFFAEGKRIGELCWAPRTAAGFVGLAMGSLLAMTERRRLAPLSR